MTDTDALVVTQEGLVAELARAIYDAKDTSSGDHVGTVIYSAEHAFYDIQNGETEADACRAWALGVCHDAAIAILPIITRACREAVEADRRTFSPTEIDQAVEAVLNVRTANAGDFKREGAAWEAYDRACLDCHAAIEAIANRNRSQDNG